MIRVSCHTNIDAFKRKSWPQRLQAAPQVGDWVIEDAFNPSMLQVVAVWHSEFLVRVELHYPKDGRSFEEHERLKTGNP